MKRAIGTLSPTYSTERMVREYTEQYYMRTAGEDDALMETHQVG